ncbi:polygalacturonase-like [Typha latifolia]|uniref:polygalacturonase-like n=1 Tax=Typha latifolia TaxID=4733 RepID=UPI003C2EB163
MKLFLHSCFLTLIFFVPVLSQNTYNVVDFGAIDDGRSDASEAFSRAWAHACDDRFAAKIYVPPGRFLLHNANFEGYCTSPSIEFWIEGTLIASSTYDDSNYWIFFYKVDNLSISGGTIDARGHTLWDCKSKNNDCPFGPVSLVISNGYNISINNLASKNSKFFHIMINNSEKVSIRNATITAPEDSPNTDGIHTMDSNDLLITNSSIMTGDDCISISRGTTNLSIQNINCGPGHGISIGSLADVVNEKPVENISVSNIIFTGTSNGLRIKTFARPSNSYVSNVKFHQITMKDVNNPIIIDQNYCPGHEECPHENSGVKITNVQYVDIKGTSTNIEAVHFDCSLSNPCEQILLKNVKC